MSRALSMTQPWSNLVVDGRKTIETRSWKTSYRGLVYVHASRGLPVEAFLFASGRELAIIPRGAVIGTVVLVDVVPVEDLYFDAILAARGHQGETWRLTTNERTYGDYSEGRYAWLVAHPVRLDEPIPARGRLGLWRYPAPSPPVPGRTPANERVYVGEVAPHYYSPDIAMAMGDCRECGHVYEDAIHLRRPDPPAGPSYPRLW